MYDSDSVSIKSLTGNEWWCDPWKTLTITYLMKMMPLIIVGELRALLDKMEDDLPVLVCGYESGYEHFYTPFIKSVKHEPENPYYDGEYQSADHKSAATIEALIFQRMVRDD